ncbi:MAG: OmpH family outer membrane protein [Bacteroidota bacterium]
MKMTSKKTSGMKRMNMVKGMIAFAAIAILSLGTANAQKYAYVNSEYILENIPEYKTAQQTLDNLSLTWQKEIEDKYAIIDKLYKAYQAEQVLLTEEMKKRRQDEITAKEKDVKDLQKQRFGYDGDLFKKKQELVKPIQDKIYNAVKKMATDQSYAVIFDKSSDLIMLYTNPKYDKSNDILLAMGYKPSQAATKETKGAAPSGTTTPTTTPVKENPDADQPKK